MTSSSTIPLVSPLYGSLAGLPPTAIYFGNSTYSPRRACRLQDKGIGDAGIRLHVHPPQCELHGWAGLFWLPEARAAKPDIYRQPDRLGGLNGALKYMASRYIASAIAICPSKPSDLAVER